MAESNSAARSLHDLGLAAWFGGSLMGAVGLNGASAEVTDPVDRARVANSGWGRWSPVNAVAIAAHLVGSLQLTRANKGRLMAERGVGSAAAVKAALTGAALGATVYARVLGQRVMEAEAREAAAAMAGEGLAVEGATEPAAETPDDAAQAQQRLRLLQWLVPALTGAVLVVNARMGEQQRPAQVVRGVLGRVLPDRLAERL